MVIHFYRLAGFFLLILAAIGVVLPLLPTTPFVLLAALCFSKSSQRWHQWLLQSPTFGPGLLRWEQQRCLNCRTKVVALFSSLGVGGASAFFAVSEPRLQLTVFALLAVGAVVVLRIKNCASAR